MDPKAKPRPKTQTRPAKPAAKTARPAARRAPAPAGGNPERAALCLQALGHPIRLLILHALRGGERTVTDLVAATGATQANVSQHLRVMRDRQILGTRKDGNLIYYRVLDPRVFNLLDAVQAVFCKHD